MSNRHCKEEVEKQSFDILGQNIETIKQLFPECICEGKIDFDKLRAILGSTVNSNTERYSFSWAGKRDAIGILNTRTDSTLNPCESESVDFDKTSNLFIEGDNLEVLKLLYKSYFGKIKMIYIDPPYNTGNDFIYKDDYSQPINQYLKLTGQKDEEGNVLVSLPETYGRRHSDWLSMMYPRLFVAKQLLTDDGVIFISIDDNEVHHLRMLMNEIFGEENFCSCITRATGTPTGGGNKIFVNEIDYVMVYFKSSAPTIEGMPLSEDEAKIYDQEDGLGRYLIRPLRRTGGEDKRQDRPSMFYPINAPDGSNILPYGPTGYESRWICGKSRYQELLANNLIEWRKVIRSGTEQWQVYQKFYLNGRLKQPSNLIDKIEGNKKATRDIRNIFDNLKVFDFPKPVELIQTLINIGMIDKDGFILDFFAGSCTTAHTVLELNRQDGGNRKFICVQLPEPCNDTSEAFKAGYATIADIGKERIRRVIQKIKSESEGKLELEANQKDLGFRVFKLDKTNYKTWNTDETIPDNIYNQTADSIDPLAHGWEKTPENVIWEVALKEGYSLSSSVQVVENISTNKVYKVSDESIGQHFYICLDEKFDMATIKALNLSIEEDNTGTLFVCRDSSLTDEMAVNINLQCRLKTI